MILLSMRWRSDLEHVIFLCIVFLDSNSCNTSGGYSEYYRGNCYKAISELKTFSEAESACEDDGGHLVTIQDDAENQFLLTFTASYVVTIFYQLVFFKFI